MLNSLDFLTPGKEWPPKDPETRERLARYQANRMIFKGKHAAVYSRQFERIERVIGNFNEVVSYAIILNYQKLISLKVADLLLGEAPEITASDENEAAQKVINEIVQNSDLINTCYMAAIDISRYGDGLLFIYPEETTGKIDITQPRIWYPIVDPDNIKRRQYEVLAWVYGRGEKGEQSYQEYLKVRIFSATTEETREYKLIGSQVNNSKQIGPYTMEPVIVEHGLKEIPVLQIPNVITSEDVTGMDDYQDVDSILSELMVRIGQVSRILDKHAAPSVTGPQSSLEKDPTTGEWKLKLGNYFPRNTNDEPAVQYLTWDGQLDSAFKQIETLINQLYVISEMGSALLGDFSSTNSGQVPSGTAMRRMMMSALAKVNRIRMRFDPALKKAIAMATVYKPGLTLETKDISINWQDGLPADPKEQADIENVRTAGKATTSITSAIKRLDDKDDEAAMEEYEQIVTDEQPAADI